MPKQKPHKGLLKRVTITAKGKVKFKRPGSGHLNSHMSGKTIMAQRERRLAKASDIRRLERLLGRRLTPSQ